MSSKRIEPNPTASGERRYPFLVYPAYLFAVAGIGLGSSFLYSVLIDKSNPWIVGAALSGGCLLLAMVLTRYAIMARTGAAGAHASHFTVNRFIMGLTPIVGIVFCPYFGYRLLGAEMGEKRLGAGRAGSDMSAGLAPGSSEVYPAVKLHGSGWPGAVVFGFMTLVHIFLVAYQWLAGLVG